MLLAEILLELSPVDHMTKLLESLGSIPPSSCRSSKIVGRIQNLLIFPYGGNFQIVVDGAKPIIGFQGVKSLGVGGWVGLLEIAQGGSQVSISVTIAIAIVVVMVVVLGIGGELLENSKVGLTLLARSLAVLHKEPKKLGRGRLRWWWWVIATMASSSSGVNHPEIR